MGCYGLGVSGWFVGGYCVEATCNRIVAEMVPNPFMQVLYSVRKCQKCLSVQFLYIQVMVVATNAQDLETVVVKLTDLFARLVSLLSQSA